MADAALSLFSEDTPSPAGNGALRLRPHQVEALEKVRGAWRTGAKNVLLEAPVAFGKTEVAVAMFEAAYQRGKHGIFVCDRLALINQTSQRFDKYGLPHGIIQGQNERFKPYEQIQVCSVQTLQRRTKWPEHDFLVVDEAHVLHKENLRKLERRECYAVGLSATPFSTGLAKYFDAHVVAETTNQMMAGGWLCPFVVYQPSVPDMRGVAVKRSDGEWQEEASYQRVRPIIGDIVAEYLRLGEGRKFICFAVNVAHAEELRAKFLAAGIIAELYTYREDDVTRSEAVEQFRKPDSHIRGLISVQALTRGFDVEDVGVVILARPIRKSLIDHCQSIGRGLRIAPGKENCILLDHAQNVERFWSEANEYWENGGGELDDGTPKKKTKRKRRGKKPVLCPSCKRLHPAAPFCPGCGFKYEKRSGVHVVPGTLERSENPNGKRARQPALTADPRTEYAELLWIARALGWKPGWAFMTYRRDHKGKWPSRPEPEPQMPSPGSRNWYRWKHNEERKR